MRLSDDELTALLAEHPNDEGCCGGCFEMAETDYAPVEWPCETVRLATEVRDLRADLRQVLQQVRVMGEDECQHDDRVLREFMHYECPDCTECMGRALARYEEGGR